MKYLFVFFFFTNLLFSYIKTTDSNNVYLSSQHFRVIYGLSYEDDAVIHQYAHDTLDIAEYSWNKEVVELGFSQPRNTTTKLIDIYLGNTSVVSIESVSTYIDEDGTAGYAWYYLSDRTPYFVINKTLAADLLKATIAHEFFHTIHYAYFIDDNISESKWYKNTWWLEATATLIEDEVYDEINDYLSFVDSFFENSTLSFEVDAGIRKYGLVIFAKYIREKYGLEIIKQSFPLLENGAEEVGYFEILDQLLQENHNSNINEALNEFVKWVSDAETYFEEGALYPPLKHFDANTTFTFGKGGVAVIDNLLKGWNMVALTNAQLNSLDIKHMQSIWSYEEGLWKNSIENEINDVNSTKGYWVYTSSESSLYYTYFDNEENDLSSLNSSWHLLGSIKKLEMNSFDPYGVIVWQYSDGIWKVYVTDVELKRILENLGYKQLDKLDAYSAYWIKKI